MSAARLDLIDDQEAQVVPGGLVLRTGVAEPDDERQHGDLRERVYFFSALSAALSAGAASPSAAGAAPGSSSLMFFSCTTGWSTR